MDKSILFKRQQYGYVLIEESVLNEMDKYRQHNSQDHEAGGLLLGFFKKQHLHITDLTKPYPKDIRSRFGFTRKDPAHLEYLEQRHSFSQGQLNLLGEWHTHPEQNPTPSNIDISNWLVLEKTRKSQNTVFVIVGISGLWVGLANGRPFIETHDNV